MTNPPDTSVTETMIEAGVGAHGGHRNIGDQVTAIYIAMQAASLTRKDGSEGVERVIELDGGSIFRAAKRKQGTRLGADTVAALADLLAALAKNTDSPPLPNAHPS